MLIIFVLDLSPYIHYYFNTLPDLSISINKRTSRVRLFFIGLVNPLEIKTKLMLPNMSFHAEMQKFSLLVRLYYIMSFK